LETPNQIEPSSIDEGINQMSDLDFLKGVKPVTTEFRTSARGRQPGENVMEAHVIASYSSPKPLAVEVPAAKAHLVERAIRRAGKVKGERDWHVSVQALKVHPDKATSKDVIALRELPGLTGDDIWLSFKATDKPAEQKATETATPSAPVQADPFKAAETSAVTGDNGAAKPAVRKPVAAK
jgi:hypothetical protein